MLEPRDLFEIEAPLPSLGKPVLIESLEGFIDAGSAKRLATAQLLSSPDARVVARFDVDQLHDYRARRPAMLFSRDHWESYDEPQLALHAVTDQSGVPFLVLAGMEPDVQWERFTAAMQVLIAEFGVRLTVGLGAIPMAVPHTRPLGVIVHGSRPELLTAAEPWVDTVQVPGSAGHLMEYRLGQAGHDAMGLAVHVPHYLAQTDYPAAAVRLLEAASAVSGLTLPTGGLVEEARTTHEAIEGQVAQSPEVAEVVRGLEHQYDLVVAGRDNLLASGSSMPTAEELGDEFERFLAQQTPKGDGS
jgi:hypothetical protein